MKKINLIAAVLAAVLAVLCTGCPNDTASETTTTTVQTTDVKVSVSELDNALKDVATGAVRITITDKKPDLSVVKSIISKSSKDIRLDLSECTGLTSFAQDAFKECNSLTSVTIPDSITRIGDFAFAYCRRLTSVTIGKGVTSIGWYAFSGCSELTSMIIPDSVKSFGGAAFFGCIELTTLTVKATTPPDFGMTMLNSCSKLTTIYVPSSSVNAYKSADGWSDYSDKIQGKSF